jgi:hypothetical protein
MAVERVSLAALAQFWRQVKDHNIPYWGPNCVIPVLYLVDRELQDIPIRALLALPGLPFHVLYPVLTLVRFRNCLGCPLINYPEDSGNPPYKFHLESTTESHSSSNAKLSSSPFMAESQPSRRSLALSSSGAKLQLSSWYNSRSNNSSNPYSPGLDNWRSNRSSDWSLDSYINGPSNDLSDPRSPGLDPWHSNGTLSEGKGSSSGIYNLKTDNGQVPQGSGSSSSSSK